LTDQRRSGLSIAIRVAAVVCAIGAAALPAYSAMLAYAGATFEHDSLPGPAVLFMVAAGVGLSALLAAGVSYVLWRMST
jgi:hypothetical protein